METQKFNVLGAESNIEWIGKKVTGAHNGTIAVKTGELTLIDGNLTGGKFIADTTSITVLNVPDAALHAQLLAHLASADFFSSEKYPEAILNISSVWGNHLEGDLTIKGITHPVDFDAVINVNGQLLTATAKLMIDRTKYEMKFRSGNFFTNLGDTLIYNDFELHVTITAKAAQ
jgi:hypothetical protein